MITNSRPHGTPDPHPILSFARGRSGQVAVAAQRMGIDAVKVQS
jgi:hypothetical protein